MLGSLPNPFAQRPTLAWVVIALVALAIVADAVYRAGPKQRTDLPVYLAGSAEVRAGRDPLLATSSRGWPYVYPPTLAVLLTPLLALPIQAAAAVWCLVCLLLLLLGLGAHARAREHPEASSRDEGAGAAPSREGEVALEGAAREVAPDASGVSAAGDSGDSALEPSFWGAPFAPRFALPLWVPLLLVALPALSALLRGQVGPLLLGCGLLAWRDLERKRDLRAGVLLAFCAAVKLTPILVVMGLLCARRWLACAGAALGLVVFLILVPLPFLGGSGTADALEHFGDHMVLRPLRDPGDPDMTSSGTHVPNNQSPISLATRHLEGAGRWLLLALLAPLVPLALLRAGWRFDLAGYGLLWGVALLVSPVAWHHHHVVLFFALAFLAERRERATLAAFALLLLLHFAVKPLRPFGLLALGTLIVLVRAGWPSLAREEPISG